MLNKNLGCVPRTSTFLKSQLAHTVVLAIIIYQTEVHERFVTIRSNFLQ